MSENEPPGSGMTRKQIQLNNLAYDFERLLDRKDLPGIAAFLDARPNFLASIEPTGRRFLHQVSGGYRYFPEAVPLLLRAGATVDLRNREGQTPLHVALHRSHDDAIATEVLVALLQTGADVNAQSSEGMTALHCAVDAHTSETSDLTETNIRLLLDHGADLSRTGYEGLTPLALAFFRTNARAVRLLRGIGAPFAAGDGYLTPSSMDWAITEDDCDAVRALLDAGAGVDERNEGGVTPLQDAAFGGCVDIVRLLLERGADLYATTAPPDEPEYGGLAALHLASNQPEVTRILLDAGADSRVRGGIYNRTPVEQAIVDYSLAVVRLYKERNAPVARKYLDDAFCYAVSSGEHVEFIALLMEWGAGQDQETLRKAARAAIYHANTENVGLLFKAGAQLAVNESTLYGELEDVRDALERGGDPNEVYVERESLTEAQYREWQTQADVRQQRGEFVESGVMTPILSAARVNDIEKARLLLSRGADPNFLAEEIGDGALFSAVMHNNAAMVALLLEHGANPNASLSHCASALEFAEQEGYEECAALLRQASAEK